jgi:hypothetical protein
MHRIEKSVPWLNLFDEIRGDRLRVDVDPAAEAIHIPHAEVKQCATPHLVVCTP